MGTLGRAAQGSWKAGSQAVVKRVLPPEGCQHSPGAEEAWREQLAARADPGRLRACTGPPRMQESQWARLAVCTLVSAAEPEAAEGSGGHGRGCHGDGPALQNGE